MYYPVSYANQWNQFGSMYEYPYYHTPKYESVYAQWNRQVGPSQRVWHPMGVPGSHSVIGNEFEHVFYYRMPRRISMKARSRRARGRYPYPEREVKIENEIISPLSEDYHLPSSENESVLSGNCLSPIVLPSPLSEDYRLPSSEHESVLSSNCFSPLELPSPLPDNSTHYADRFNLHEERDLQAWKFYKQQLAQRWDSDEILLSEDKNEFNKLNDRYKLLIEDLVAFFAPGDGLVCEQVDQLKAETTDFAQRAFLGEQYSIEVVHARAYKDIILTFFDEEIQRRIFASVDTLPCVQDKASFIVKYMEDKSRPLSLRYVAAAVSEGVFFVSLFAVIFYIREKKILNHFCFLNEQVSKDEKLHRDFDLLIARRGLRKGEFTREQALEIVEEGIRIEMIHIRYILRMPIDDPETDAMGGMTIENMDRFIHTLADQIMVGLGFEASFTYKSIANNDDSEGEASVQIDNEAPPVTTFSESDKILDVMFSNVPEEVLEGFLESRFRNIPMGKLAEFSPPWMKGLSMIRKPNFYEVPVGNYSMISQRKQMEVDFDMEDLTSLGI